LFGIGDLRTDDHVGLHRAWNNVLLSLQQTKTDDDYHNNNIMAVCIFNDDMIRAMPGGTSHTYDTVAMCVSAWQELAISLQEQYQGLPLHIVTHTNESVTQILERIQTASSTKRMRVHVCDLGLVDNQMGYNAFSYLQTTASSSKEGSSSSSIEIIPWSHCLREEPWQQVQDLPTSYLEYQKRYQSSMDAIPPISSPNNKNKKTEHHEPQIAPDRFRIWESYHSSIPTIDSVLERFRQVLNLDSDERIRAEIQTGLYGTHWGGLSQDSFLSVGCRTVVHQLHAYTHTCQQDDAQWMKQQQPQPYASGLPHRNPKSLEHASMIWQLRGKSGNKDSSVGLQSENWLAGEAMTRYLAAPLLLGTISPRRIWHSTTPQPMKLFFESPLRKLVEGQEWHRLLAAHNILNEDSYRGEGSTVYKYWRYHGFLCRYVETAFPNANHKHKEGVLMVHGFGASGAQWNKLMCELSEINDVPVPFFQGLAPDLLGFGQSEKPAISYTGYLWAAQIMDFVKEIAMQKNRWDSYVVGGNSIGGFTSMSLAACDSATIHGEEVSSSGAPGTNRCTGLVLMNSAGPIQTRSEIQDGEPSVAQITILDELPACQPPPRPVSRVFGNILLQYLRPRIQSICVNLYPTNPAAVDDHLCENILRDSFDPGAIAVMMAGSKLPKPRTANELLAADFGSSNDGRIKENQFTGPVLIAQGILDPLNDAKDRMQRYGALRQGITMDPIEAGHCPHDEVPDLVARSIANWYASSSCVASDSTISVATSFVTVQE
jgi:pimeloyl-ACP methyl ester carboxylesterase